MMPLPPSSHSRAIKQRKKKQRKVKEGNSNALFLPEEIINNILKRLPVKSLIRFQSVSKLWKTLIQTPSFTHENFHYYSIHNPGILFGDSFPLDSTQLYFLNSDMEIVELNCASVSHILFFSFMIGACNGLICLGLRNTSYDGFVLWNPSTRQLNYAPKPENNSSFRVGFGFSSVLDDYNIISIDYRSGERGSNVQVYSFKTGSWKQVESSPLRGFSVSGEKFSANGRIMWVGLKFDFYLDIVEEVIISYDMVLEVFTLIPSPSHVSPIGGFDSFNSHITIHENKLALLSRTSAEDCGSGLIDLWVMEDGTGEYGGRYYEWTKKFSISHPSLCYGVTIWRNKMVCYPWCTRAAEGEKLADERKSIGLVDLTTSEVEMFDIGIYGTQYPLLNHVESLLPVGDSNIEEL